MKKLLILFSLLSFILIFSSCSEDDNNPASSENLNLDNDLFGKWSFTDSNNDVLSYTFNSNGTCVQTVYDQNVNWNWTIEEEQLKLFVTGGIPAYFTYKIEGSQLYLWIDSVNDWGLPFTKQ
jgi:hypothetical protein